MTRFADELAAIHAAFASSVVYTGAGLTAAAIGAVYSDVPGDPFQGAGATVRHVSFEVLQSTLPQAPAKENTLVHEGVTWRVIDIVRRDDVAAWTLSVERAA